MVGPRILEDGAVIGDHKILRLLSSSGRTQIYLARHARTGVKVALKCADARRVGAPSESKFRQALRSIIAHKDPNLVEIYAGGIHKDTHKEIHWIAMELLDGTPINERTTNWFAVMSFGLVVAVALELASHMGILHGGLTPLHIRKCKDDTLVVLGLGSDWLFGPREAGSDPSIFQAPELLFGEPSDERSDIYSLGMIMHAAILQAPPFGDAEPTRNGKLVLLHEVVACPLAFSEFIEQCTRKDPKARFQSWEDFCDTLQMIAFYYLTYDRPTIEALMQSPVAKHESLLRNRDANISVRKHNDVMKEPDHEAGSRSTAREGESTDPIHKEMRTGSLREENPGSASSRPAPLESGVQRKKGAQIQLDAAPLIPKPRGDTSSSDAPPSTLRSKRLTLASASTRSKTHSSRLRTVEVLALMACGLLVGGAIGFALLKPPLHLSLPPVPAPPESALVVAPPLPLRDEPKIAEVKAPIEPPQTPAPGPRQAPALLPQTKGPGARARVSEPERTPGPGSLFEGGCTVWRRCVDDPL